MKRIINDEPLSDEVRNTNDYILLTVPTVKIVLLVKQPQGRCEDAAFDRFSKYLYGGPSTMTLGYELPRVCK